MVAICRGGTIISINGNSEVYNEWCKKLGYKPSSEKAVLVYQHAKECVATLPKNDYTKKLVQTAAEDAQDLGIRIAQTQAEMECFPSLRPIRIYRYSVNKNSYYIKSSIRLTMLSHVI